jgi:endonuclease/exonuclease/phosphatase (EEP) superfamily protein YafD
LSTKYIERAVASVGDDPPTPQRRRLRDVVATIVIVHTAFVVLWFVVLLLWPDGWWPFILLNVAVVQPLLVAGFVWMAAVAIGERRLVVIASIPILLFASLYWPYAVPDFATGPDADAQPDLRVMTFNILNENDDVAAVLAVIDGYEPDVVAVQELTAARAPDFRTALVDTHPHSIIASPVTGGTTALFSRTPLTTATELDFGIDRPAVLATTTVDGHEIVVGSAHLNPAFYALAEPWLDRPAAIGRYANDQHSQAEQLLAELATYEDLPAFVGCDCNTRELNETNQILSRSLTDPIRELGFPLRRSSPPGTTNERRLGHIDYVWYRSGTDGAGAGRAGADGGGGARVTVTPDGVYRIDDQAGSDHHPIIADFELALD